MAASFGIHVGSSSACIAVCRDGRADVIANDSGDRVTPAVLSVSQDEIVVGQPAKQGSFRNTSSTIVNCKTLLGRETERSDVDELSRYSLCPLTVSNGKICYEVDADGDTQIVPPEQALQYIYKKLRDFATHQSSISDSRLRAVVAVPHSFSTSQRKLVQQAADKAGFEVLQVVSEPAAAMLAYNVGQTSKHDNLNCLVYRCGGASLDVSVVLVRSGMYSIASSVQKENFGGDKFTSVVANFLADEFFNKWKLDPRESKRSMSKLKIAAEDGKHILSTLNTAHCFVESLCEGVDLSVNLSRARLDMLVAPLLPEFIEPIQEALTRASLSSEAIHKVVLCGGSTKMLKLQQAVKDVLPQSEILTSLAADEVIAIGASQQAAILSEPFDSECQNLRVKVPALKSPLFLRCGEKDEHLLEVFSAFTPLPSRQSIQVPLGKNHSSTTVEILEDSKPLARLTLSDLPEAPSIVANFHLGSDGVVHVALTEKMTNVTSAVSVPMQA